MIFPILSGLVGLRHAPITWTLVIFNFLVLVYTSLSGLAAQDGLEDLMRKPYFVATQGRLYSQYLAERASGEYPEFIVELGRQVQQGKSGRAEMLGQLAFRDFNFMKAAETMDFEGDKVAVELWRQRSADLERLEESHPSFTLGLNAGDTSLRKWISYIFVHSGFLHFAGNMLFLLIFGAALERQIGGLAMLIVFLLSGTFAAGVFATMTGVTSSPLVGASGAISGVMTLYCVLNWRTPTRYFYWFFLPFRGFMGLIYLPAWVALVLWAINDLAGYFGSLAELGGVAHTAHLGGEVAGLLTGLIIFSLRRYWPGGRDQVTTAATTPPPMGVLMPFLPHRRVG